MWACVRAKTRERTHTLTHSVKEIGRQRCAHCYPSPSLHPSVLHTDIDPALPDCCSLSPAGFLNKFGNFAKNEFYITSESYGGQ